MFELQNGFFWLALDLMGIFVQVYMFIQYMKTYIVFQVHAHSVCITKCGFEPNRQSKFATMPAIHPPVEVQSGVTHGE